MNEKNNNKKDLHDLYKVRILFNSGRVIQDRTITIKHPITIPDNLIMIVNCTLFFENNGCLLLHNNMVIHDSLCQAT